MSPSSNRFLILRGLGDDDGTGNEQDLEGDISLDEDTAGSKGGERRIRHLQRFNPSPTASPSLRARVEILNFIDRITTSSSATTPSISTSTSTSTSNTAFKPNLLATRPFLPNSSGAQIYHSEPRPFPSSASKIQLCMREERQFRPSTDEENETQEWVRRIAFVMFLGERIEAVVRSARDDGGWYSWRRPVFGDVLRCLRARLDDYEGDGEEYAPMFFGAGKGEGEEGDVNAGEGEGNGDEEGWEEVYQKQYWERDGWCDCCGAIDNCMEADWWNLVDGVYDGWGRF